MAKEWSMKDMIDAAIRKVNQDFHCTEDTLIVPEELKSFILGKLPEDFDFEGLNIKGKQTNFRAYFVTKDIYVLRHKTGPEVRLFSFNVEPFIIEIFRKFPQDKRRQLFRNNKHVFRTMEILIHFSNSSVYHSRTPL